jgi:hypothetical protein
MSYFAVVRSPDGQPSGLVPILDPVEYDPARDVYIVTEAEYAATRPARMDAVADALNERLADVLPDGMRFAWDR